MFDLEAYLVSTLYADAAFERVTTFQQGLGAVHEPRSWGGSRRQYEDAVCAVPGYDGIDWSREDYWSTVPLIDKSTLRNRMAEFVTPERGPSGGWARETSGTLGPPIRIPYDPLFAMEYRLCAAYKIAWLAGYCEAVIRRQRVFCLTLFERKAVPAQVWADPTGTVGLTIYHPFDERASAAASHLTELVARYRPALVALKPNMLETILAEPGGRHRWVDLGVVGVISGGANLSDEVRTAAADRLGVPVCNEYGLTEVGVVASECPVRQGLHVYEGEVLPEVLTADGDIRADGSGELVVSSIANKSLPLLRYRTGDLVTLTSSPCACGRTGRRLLKLSGRIVHNFRFDGGRVFSPTNLDEMFRLFPVHEYRVAQTGPAAVRVELEPVDGAAEQWRRTLADVHAYLRRQFGDGIRVETATTRFSRTERFQRYVSLL